MTNLNRTTLSRKSWVPYARLLARYLAIDCIGSIALGLGKFHTAWQVFTILLICSLLWQIFSLFSCQLYYDATGVWFQSGLFPWDKGIVGLDWVDTQGCLCSVGFRSWFSRSYQIVITHRFTDRGKLVLNDMSNGRNTCITINRLHQDFAKN
jgi:hypothetical protein